MMASYEDFELGSTVSFEVYPSAILGTGFKRMKVMGILDADSARGWIDPESMHANVYSQLPDGTPDAFDEYYYLKIKGPDGQINCVGLPWIIASSIEVHATNTVKLTIENVSQSDIERLRKALAANGLKATDLRIV